MMFRMQTSIFQCSNPLPLAPWDPESHARVFPRSHSGMNPHTPEPIMMHSADTSQLNHGLDL